MNEATYACSLTDEELTARRTQWKELEKRMLLRTEPLPSGRLVVYEGGEQTARNLSHLIESERQCCPFLGFHLERRGEEVHLTLRFPAEAKPAVDYLV